MPEERQLVGHQVVLNWMGSEVLTLADLTPASQIRAVVVGINPTPTSVAGGHYYRGRLGQQFFARLRQAGVLRPSAGGWDDDEAVVSGLGFTDFVKRPTASSSELRPEEYQHGRQRLLECLSDVGAPMVLFTFKKAAEILLGRFQGHGLLDQPVEGSRAFVMPGPYERAEVVTLALTRLGELFDPARPSPGP